MAKVIELVQYVDVGIPTSEAFNIKDIPAPETCGNDECVVRLLYISADPYMRGRIRSTAPGYIENLTLHQPISGFVTCEVIVSKHAGFSVGDLLGAFLPYITIQVLPSAALSGAWRLNDYCTKDKSSLGIGLFGMPGMTAYFGLNRVLQPKEGQTLFVNAAAGAVGNVVGQLAKAQGCRVVGSAGGTAKVSNCLSKGFDACIDYKVHSDKEAFAEEVKKACPSGVDMYFENVGGYQWEAVVPQLAKRGRVAICGCIDSYNDWSKVQPNFFSVGWALANSITVRGFLVFEWMGIEAERKLALGELKAMYDKGSLRVDETILDGVEKFPEALAGLFTGANTGKMVIRV